MFKQKSLVLFSILIALLFILSMKTHGTFVDATTNNVQANQYANGRVCLDASFGEASDTVLETVDNPDECWMSKYHPGTALWGTPFYFTFQNFTTTDLIGTLEDPPTAIEVPSLWIGALAGATAVFGGFLMLTNFNHQSGISVQKNILISGVLFLGTSMWSTAANQLWMHSINSLLLIGATVAFMKNRSGLFGLFLGLSIIVRPLVGLLAIPVFIYYLFKKDWQSFLKAVVPITLFSFLALLYSKVFFDSWAIDAGYRLETPDPGVVASRNIEDSPFFSRIFKSGAMNYVRGLFDSRYGLLFVSPIVGYLTWATIKAKENKYFVILSGGILYLFVQWALNRASGGYAVGYRYPLESLAFVFPVFALALAKLDLKNPFFVILALFSIAQQLKLIIFFDNTNLISNLF